MLYHADANYYKNTIPARNTPNKSDICKLHSVGLQPNAVIYASDNELFASPFGAFKDISKIMLKKPNTLYYMGTRIELLELLNDCYIYPIAEDNFISISKGEYVSNTPAKIVGTPKILKLENIRKYWKKNHIITIPLNPKEFRIVYDMLP